MKSFCFIFSIVFTFFSSFFCETGYTAIFCVSNADELQSALTTASSNSQDDMIKIQQGTYVGHFLYAAQKDYNLTIEGGYTLGCSSRDLNPVNTVIDGNESGFVLSCSSWGTGVAFVIDGLTLQKGYFEDEPAGGIHVYNNGDVIISNNIITENKGGYTSGGGAHIESEGNITIFNNIISNNTIGGYGDGGGIYAVAEGNITISDNTITNNQCESDGGGIYAVAEGNTTISDNTITNNQCHSYGGGIKVVGSNTIISDNTITANDSIYGLGPGGLSVGGYTLTLTNNIITGHNDNAIYIQWSNSITFNNNNISNNSDYSWPGGILILGSDSLTFTNNIITENSSTRDDYAGGVHIGDLNGEPSYLDFINNTITGNKSGHDVGGLYIELSNDAVANIINNIIWNNTSSNNQSNSSDFYINNDHNNDNVPCVVNLYNNDFKHNSLIYKIPFPIDPSNLDNEDPLFINAANSDYHLSGSSPCIDVGRLEEAPSVDIDGEPRPMGSGVDIGADEYTSSPPTTSSTTTTSDTTTTIPTTTTTTELSTTTTKECLSLKIYGEHSEEVEFLRYLRDNILSQSPAGQEIIKLYYEWSPIIVKAMEEDEAFKEDVKEMIDGVLELIIETE